MTALAIEPDAPEPRSYSTAWWGMATVVLTEAMVFVILLSAYFFLEASAKQWPLGRIDAPDLSLALPFSFVLWGSSLPVFVAEAALRKGDVPGARRALGLSFAMGALFVAYTVYEFSELSFGWRDNAYASIFFTIVGLHAVHVVVGLAMSVVVQAKAWLGRYDEGAHASAEVFALYWHFVDIVWLFVFVSLFVGPHIR